MCITFIALFVFISDVTCMTENSSENKSIGRNYNFNRPPWAEDYNPIPVAVVYEDDTITEGSNIQEKTLNQNQFSDINIVNQTSEVNEEPTTKFTETITTKKYGIAVTPKGRALSDLQIPVAVIYDKMPLNNQGSHKVRASETNNPKRRYKQIRRRKEQKLINEHEPIIQNTESVKPQTLSIEPFEPIPRELNALKSKIEPVEGYTKRSHGKRERDPVVPIVNSENYVFSHNGNFHYSYEAGDGTKAHSEGQLMRSENNEAVGEAVSGGFSYTDKDGNDFSLSYTADERGYRPTGAHLPTPPPIPPAIARALAYLATATTPEPVTKSSVMK